jgi:endonuclease YncB( thermonuclease family)
MGNCCGVPADGKTQRAPQATPDSDDLVRSRPVDLVRSPPVHDMNEYIDGLVAAAVVVPPAAAVVVPPDEEKLAHATCGKDFSFAGQRFLAKIVDYYDGDTVRVAFEYGGQLIQYKARMAGYDSPEMKPLKSNPNREAEKAAAIAARAALIGKVGGALVYIECDEFDKYGRLLATVYLRDGHENGENVNTWMVANGHGTPYDGGKKTPFAGAD